MVPVNLNINLYELKEKIKKEVINRVLNIDVFDYPLDSAWLLYALFIEDGHCNPFFKEWISKFKEWALSEKAGKEQRDLASLSLCGFLLSETEAEVEIVRKVREITSKAIETFFRSNVRFNVLNDPVQVFCVSLLLKNEEDMKNQIINIIKRNINGRITRKVFFIASLIEFGEDIQSYLGTLEFREDLNVEDIISYLWFSERYRDITRANLTKLWKSFDRIYPSIEVEEISSRNLAILYEAITKEITEPDPNMLFDIYPLHPQIKEIAKEYFKNKKYTAAVFEATKKLNELIQNRTGIKNKNESDLVQATMKKIGNPEKLIVKFNDFLNEDSGKSEQKGLALITEGIFCAFRNPKGHKPEDHPLVNIDPYEALAQLIIIDYIWKRIEKAKINVTGDKRA